MSVERVHRATLWCDRYSCINKISWQTGHYLSLKTIAAWARRSNWSVGGGEYLCPEHRRPDGQEEADHG